MREGIIDIIKNWYNVQNKSADEMLLIERTAMDLLPLSLIVSTLILIFSQVFIVFGGGIPYVFQYKEILERKNAQGFSLYVCLALCVANILRILFWFGKKFEVPLLAQSVLMLICMILMLEISVRMNRRLIHKSLYKSIWHGDLISSFWAWSDLTSYLFALIVFSATWSIATYFLLEFEIYIETLGLFALLVEACLGMPQLIRNFQRRSTIGMSVRMVLMWLIGDCAKTLYFIVRSSPMQFWVCAILQITVDILILLQVYIYGKGPTLPYTSSE